MTTKSPHPGGRVLQVGSLKPSLAETLRTTYDALMLPDSDDRAGFLAAHADDVVLAVTSGHAGVDGALMSVLPRLRAVVNFGAGYDTTDIEAALRLGIVVSNTPDVLTDCVADTALGLTLDVMRGLSAADRFVRKGLWLIEGSYPLTRQVSGARVGILGLGRIGRAIATRLEALGCLISYHSRSPVNGVSYAYAATATALAASVDVAGRRHVRRPFQHTPRQP